MTVDLDRQLRQIAIEASNLPHGTDLTPEMTADDIPQWKVTSRLPPPA